MKTHAILIAILIFLTHPLIAQKSSIDLVFTGDNNGDYVTLDSIYIKNLTQSADVMLYAPDTTINLLWTGLYEFPEDLSSLSLAQNFPNPFKGKTEFNLSMNISGMVAIEVTNLLGQNVARYQSVLNPGNHLFSFTSGSKNIYLLSVSAFGYTKTIKLSSITSSGGNYEIEYLGSGPQNTNLKLAGLVKYLPFEPGDALLFVGYNELGESGILDSPEESKTYTFQYATNIPCIGVPTVDYEGQVYNTIQIYSQCWLKENLNVGTMIDAPDIPTNNNIIEKYCMVNIEDNCNIVGGLYYWYEMMQYTTTTGGQGICPDGWHIPDDMDWQLLEGAVDSEYKIGSPEWGSLDWRGADAGGNLKQAGTTLWMPPNTGATDDFGFTALPGGYYVQSQFWGPGHKCFFWNSNYGVKYYRNMDFDQKQINRQYLGSVVGVALSVRCVKD